MRFITLEHEGNTALAYKWLNTCDAGCCESLGIEMRMIFAGDYVTMFIEAGSEKELDALIENTKDEYVDVLKEVFVRWLGHLSENPPIEDDDELDVIDEMEDGDAFIHPFISTRLQ